MELGVGEPNDVPAQSTLEPGGGDARAFDVSAPGLG